MVKYFSILTVYLFLVFESQSQLKVDTIAWIKHTSIKDQQMSGTCWSFGTTSFIESEILRINKDIVDIDLSEMYFVYYNYINKLQRYYLLTGYMYWTMGGQPHDVMNVIKQYGFVPENLYQAYTTPENGHNHAKLDTSLKRIVEKINYLSKFSIYSNKFKDTLNYYLGEIPDSFFNNGKKTSGKEYCSKIKINANEYITITSFSHHPYYEWFVLEDKFNWASELYYNVPWNIFEIICDSALIKGYSFVWDGDVTENGFNPYKGYATISSKKNSIENERLIRLFSHDTKIDHVMHIIGLIKKDGETYYVVKNSWGKIGQFRGYVLMSKEYFRQKTVAVMINIDALPRNMKLKF